MAYDYDKLYGETRNALGEPTSVFVDFFDQLDQQNVRVLDAGCGQGRDAVFIARKGHRVVGVDISTNGIRDLKDVAARENLPIDGVVDDIATYEPDETFDIILIDRTLHILARPARLSALKTMLDHVNEQAWLLIADEASNIEDFETVVSAHVANWKPSPPSARIPPWTRRKSPPRKPAQHPAGEQFTPRLGTLPNRKSDITVRLVSREATVGLER